MKSRIIQDPHILRGKPVIRGTRIPVELLLRKISQGIPEKEILSNYPRLTRADLKATVRARKRLLKALQNVDPAEEKALADSWV